MTATSAHQPTRADGILARRRLLEAALPLFAAKGYQQTSTREIADAADANLAAINYYFGDKAGLYRAVFSESLCADDPSALPLGDAAGQPLELVLAAFFHDFLTPLKNGAPVDLVMRLHFRELLDPSGVLGQEHDAELAAVYTGLTELLTRHFSLAGIDTDIQRLAHSIIGLALPYYVARDLIDRVSAGLLADAGSVDTLADRLASYAVALVDNEHRRRRAGSSA
ncbi:MAG: CerR family C-terminal domain-containing protein [Proteobacteria bacterium]|nr:CerR family C-terminal domain-containing protein [Pseudomonadota bacterium]